MTSNKKIYVIAFIIGSFFLLTNWLASNINIANADQAITVSASISSSVSCSAAPTTTAFGTLTTSSVHTSNTPVTATTSCNYAAGCTISVYDVGQGAGQPGLYSESAGDLVESATAGLSAGTEGYGIQAATTGTGSGGTLTLNAIYDKSGDNIGGLFTSGSAEQLASSTLPIANREVQVTHKAAISGLTKAGAYADTIT